MASFVGTFKEFKRYIGPQFRNLVQQITRKHKATIAACEHCGGSEILEAAHVRGRDRNEIIEFILEEFTTNGIATIDLTLAEERFKEEHNPIEKCILVLCHSCHRQYDSKTPETVLSEPSSSEADSCILPITLEPSNPELFKKALLISKKAEIETLYFNGGTDRKVWNASKFRESSNVFGNLRSRPEYRSKIWQDNGIVKVHVRIIENA